MEFIELIIIIAILVTFSNIVSKILPSVPIFFIQIILGILLGLTEMGQEIAFEPEMFLVMIIGPLLFREGERADVPEILKNSKIVLFLAFGGVLLTLFAVGTTLHWLMPSIPLAACYAFGAALGPTDAVAVSSLAKRLKISKNIMHILEGEGLLNDASGVTALQFAIVALVTGSFSVMGAGFQLLFSSIGGGLIGYLIVWLKRRIIRFIEKISAQDVTVYLLIELLLPFAAYLIAEMVGVSGIIAVVVAGVAQAQRRRRVSLFDAELANISESTWSTIVFTLNALVFLFLGIELSQVFSPIWESNSYANGHLVLTIVVVTLVIFFIRFLFLLFYYQFLQSKKIVDLKQVALLTFGGVKGTVSLAAIFILPVTINGDQFEARSLLLFLTACVILATLVISVLVLPYLADGEAAESVDFNQLLILEEVIQILEEEEKEITDAKERLATDAVINTYENRRWELYRNSLTDSEKQEIQEIQGLILSIEQDGLDEAYRKGEVSSNGYRFYSRFISQQQHSLAKQFLSFFSFWLLIIQRFVRIIFHPKLFWQRQQQLKDALKQRDISEVQKIYIKNSDYIFHSLSNLEDVYDSSLINFFIRQREMSLKRFEHNNFIETIMIEQEPIFVKKVLRGYYLERKTIDEYEVAEKIPTISANEYRRNVNLLESYAMARADEQPKQRMFRR
ncbi:sodium:proton antiporter [Enterococcus gallinarum]|nr:sodium:proton antiporter [Enterococcus gallinarum]KIL82917.1 sodium:proton antiporter [Enterococcus gallinarum]